MNIQKSNVSKQDLSKAALVVGMVVHSTRHSQIKADMRKGHFQRNLSEWMQRSGASASIVSKALNRLLKNPTEWDRVGQSTFPLYNKLAANEAVAAVVDNEA
ncbi:MULTISPECIES: hypothetical protein [Gammaproteobacteria]|uniref:hypothetical protein n=1 Tax=Gammaproteobacteria TaxID=1236 RepID=UPI000C25D7FF|nr:MULTISPECIES: hypothetical protein [Stenotrophomonas]MBH1571800.1 hypothetical protein [Stenotrophomonas maltophilia]MCF3548505.1 hypothetical protein [Stenotrophomonas maltophilia]MCF3556637.1 hypothetical protein [Stenotrophomonas maltophilia]MCF3564148.1 hypothetical protein [Stenotrophomonas maltophilia]MCI1156800.1 hypothetical protein [Stenotrophomonas maltophilia]